MDLDVAHRESEFDEMDSSYCGGTHMDDDVGVDVPDFMQHISTRYHGQHVVDEMEATSWTWAWLTYILMEMGWILDQVDFVT